MESPTRHEPAGGRSDPVTSLAVSEALAASEARYRTLIEKNADGILVLRRTGTIIYANPAAEVLLGRTARQLAGTLFGIPVTPGETTEIDVLARPRPESRVAESRVAESRVAEPRAAEPRAAEPRVAEMRVVETEWQDETCYLISLRDITERKQAGEALRFLAEASRMLGGTLDVSTTLSSLVRLAVPHLCDTCVVDLVDEETGGFRRALTAHADPARARQVGRFEGQRPTAPDTGAGPWAQVIAGRAAMFATPAESQAVLPHLATSPEELTALAALGCRSLMIVPLVARQRTLGSLILIAAESGRTYGPVDLGLAEDLARRAALALDNARLYDSAQGAVRRRDDFLAMLSHELRNPLAATLHAVKILRQNLPPEPVLTQAAEVLERQGRQMARLLEDLLEVSRFNCGKITLRPTLVDLADVVDRVAEAARPLFENRVSPLEVITPADRLYVTADPPRLEQVLVNLIHNATKYTPPTGRIQMRLARADGHAVVAVADTGSGIPPELLPRIFDPFTQVSQTLDRAQGGLGLGLTLVRNLVELHGGTVTAASPGLGLGSEFTVRLPLTAPPAAGPSDSRAASTPGPGSGRRILLVEDSQDNRLMLAQLLRLLGHTVLEAADGREGVRQLADERPDVAIVDIGLPDLDGFEVARRARALPRGGEFLLIALSGYGQPDDRARGLAVGFDAYLVKPVDLDELLSRLAAPATPA